MPESEDRPLAEDWSSPVVVDGNLVSARTWHDNTPFMKEFVRMLKEYVAAN